MSRRNTDRELHAAWKQLTQSKRSKSKRRRRRTRHSTWKQNVGIGVGAFLYELFWHNRY